MRSNSASLRHLLNQEVVELTYALGREPGVIRYEQENIRSDSIRQKVPYRPEYYTAHRWLSAYRDQLRHCICDEWHYEAKRRDFRRGDEEQLIVEIANVIADVVGDEVDPVLVAVVLFKQGLESLCSHTRDVENYLIRVKARMDRGEYDAESLALARRAHELAPSDAEANYCCGSVLLVQGEWRESMGFLEAAVNADPAHSYALNDLAYILTTHALDVERGFEYAKQALSMTLAGSWEEKFVLDTVGWSFYTCEGNLEEAQRYLREAVDRDEENPTPLCHLAIVTLRRGNVREANAGHEEALKQLRETFELASG